mmetsp:Transcript_40420/g.35879  ORF Transcript_40420/g.35879 Transcript_40420/m.35879 type:complete len:158 (+) Transcript_40420:321-794(+)
MLVTGGQYVGDKTSPGPGAYNCREINKKVIAFTFRPKTTADNMITSKHGPGPGAYTSIDATNVQGRYVVSSHKGSRAPKINPPKAGGNGLRMSNDPGPGQYDLKTDINKSGSYFVSRFRSSVGRSFGTSPRRTGQLGYFENTPGPGSYRLPSDFPHF